MSIVSEIERIQQAKNDIKHAIEERGVEVGNITIDNYAEKIIQIPTGGGESPYPIIEGNGPHEVRFIDFDGTILKIQYVNDNETATPPELPEHELLTFIGWNNSDYTDVTRDVDTGAFYRTTNGATYIWHTVNEEYGFRKTVYLKVTTSGSGVINWGDGTQTTISGSSGLKTLNHEYTKEGDYCIIIDYSGKFTFGNGTRSYCLFGEGVRNYKVNWGIKKMYLGLNCSGMNAYAMFNAINLEVLSAGPASVFGSACISGAIKWKCFVGRPSASTGFTLPSFESCDLRYLPLWDGINHTSSFYRYCSPEKILYPKKGCATVGYAYTAYYNTRVRKILLPEDVTDIGTYFITWSHSLIEMIFPEGVVTLGNYSAYMSRTLTKVVVPSTVTSIGNFAFTGSTSITDIYIYAEVPPTLGGTGCFNQLSTTFNIHVPASSLDAYKTATNWSAQATKIVGDL